MVLIPTRVDHLPPTRRQIWATATSYPSLSGECFAYNIPAGTIFINTTYTFELNTTAVFQPECAQNSTGPPNATIPDNAIVDFRDPYFASTSPVAFVLAVCLTISWVLFLMLLLTPRTYVGVSIGPKQKRREGLPVSGIGNRPWFQKVAALFVAISLLIATVVTFNEAENQYNAGYQDSFVLARTTLNSTEIRSIRFISTIFEWLAQAQTALRLFQRHRERVAIKWCALSLILLECIFGIINNFTQLGDDAYIRARHNIQALPALQYLFEIALSLMYMAVVVYYALTKRRYAFYHSQMWNITVVAFLALTSILLPVVFFVLDLAVADVWSWGEYVLWVGDAAASVIVWEWVDRIESLERFERRDGILGREIFEGDEMFDGDLGPDGSYGGRIKRLRTSAVGSGSGSATLHKASSGQSLAGAGSGSGTSATLASTRGLVKKRSAELKSRFPRVNKQVLAKIAMLRSFARRQDREPSSSAVELQQIGRTVRRRRRPEAESDTPPSAPDPTALIQSSVSPVSRSDTTSASTIYRVVHHRNSPSSTPGISETLYPMGDAMNVPTPLQGTDQSQGLPNRAHTAVNLANLNPFRRQSRAQPEPPLQSLKAPSAEVEPVGDDLNSDGQGIFSVSGILSRLRRGRNKEPLPPLVIPWRGDDSDPLDHDVEAGRIEHATLHDIDEGEDDEGDSRPRENYGHQGFLGGRNTPPTDDLQGITRGSTTLSSEDLGQARRSPTRQQKATSSENHPP